MNIFLRYGQGLTLLSVVALFFSPFMRVMIQAEPVDDFLIIGMGVMGEDFRLENIALARDFQMLLLSVLAMSTFLTMFSKGKMKLMLLTISIFLITFLPIWLMAYLEGFLRPQFGGAMQYEYSFAWFILGLALVGTTVNLLVLKKEEYQDWSGSKGAVQVLDF